MPGCDAINYSKSVLDGRAVARGCESFRAIVKSHDIVPSIGSFVDDGSNASRELLRTTRTGTKKASASSSDAMVCTKLAMSETLSRTC